MTALSELTQPMRRALVEARFASPLTRTPNACVLVGYVHGSTLKAFVRMQLIEDANGARILTPKGIELRKRLRDGINARLEAQGWIRQQEPGAEWIHPVTAHTYTRTTAMRKAGVRY